MLELAAGKGPLWEDDDEALGPRAACFCGNQRVAFDWGQCRSRVDASRTNDADTAHRIRSGTVPEQS